MSKDSSGNGWRQRVPTLILTFVPALTIAVVGAAALKRLFAPTRGSFLDVMAHGVPIAIGVIVMVELTEYLERRS